MVKEPTWLQTLMLANARKRETELYVSPSGLLSEFFPNINTLKRNYFNPLKKYKISDTQLRRFWTRSDFDMYREKLGWRRLR